MSADIVRAIFNQIDTDHDGKITRSEFDRWVANGGFNKLLSNRGGDDLSAVSSSNANFGVDTAATYNQVDTNHDGSIDQGQYTQGNNDGFGAVVSSSSSNTYGENFSAVNISGDNFGVGTSTGYNQFDVNGDSTSLNVVGGDYSAVNSGSATGGSEFSQWGTSGNESSQWATGGIGESVSSSSSNTYGENFSAVNSIGGDFGADTGAVYNQVDVNRDSAVNHGEFSQWTASGYGGVSDSSSNVVGGDYSAVSSGGATGENEFSQWSSNSYSANNTAVTGGCPPAVAQTGGCEAPRYQTDSRGFFVDPNPQIINRAATGEGPTYQQNIKIRFLQPPPLPPHGPIVIREVCPPRPKVPPPLRIREPVKPAPKPPPLIMRERPPRPPSPIPAKEVTETLKPYPTPPRSVIIERLPAPPTRPRDIILERWVPYGPQPKRRTIVQRAPPAKEYARPRNLVIQYDPIQVRVVRQFQRLDVTQADPKAYLQQHGARLVDTATLLRLARSAGVVEDLTPPSVASSGSWQSSASGSVSADSNLWSGAAGSESGYGVAGSASDYGVAGSASGYGAVTSESGYGAAGSESGYGAVTSESGYGAVTSASGYGAVTSESGYGAVGSASNYGAVTSESTFGGVASSEQITSGGGFDAIGTAFRNADTNNDGSLSRDEFSRFIQGGL